MLLEPQTEEQFPCQALYYEDEQQGTTYLMFERELTQTERMRVRDLMDDRNTHWANTSTLVLL